MPGPPLRKQPLRALRRGFSNTNLLAAIGLLALITFLLQIQSGEINPLTWFAKKPAAAGKAKSAAGKKGKAPPMIVFPADPLREAGERYVKQRQTDLAEAESTQRDLWLAVAHMDSDAAAAMLAAMEQTAAVRLLSNLEQRDLARILEAAPPAQAALWAAALLNQPQPPPVPDAFKQQAKQAGLYDDTAELLQENAANANSSAGTEVTPGTANPDAVAGSAPPPDQGTAGVAGVAPPAPGTSVLPGAFYDRPPPPAGNAAPMKQTATQTSKPPVGGKCAKQKAKAHPQNKRRKPPGTVSV